jgi:hypothetical protein
MATTYKILGQITGSVTSSFGTLYTAPGSTQTVVSSLVVSNQSATNTPYNIAVIPSGGSLTSKNYLAYNVAISGSDSIALTLGITLGAGDFVQVSGVPTGSFSLFGSEIS